MNISELKERARQQLGNGIFKNPWMMALLACLISSAILGVTGSIVMGIGALIVFGPLNYGLDYLFLKQARDNEPMNIGDIFKGFTDDFGQTFLLGLMINIFTILWALLLIVPGIIKAYAYSMAYFIKADHPELRWKDCIDRSVELMKGKKWNLFVLDLSFIGWYIVGALCLGVGVLWVVPYHNAARTHFYNALVSGTAYIEE